MRKKLFKDAIKKRIAILHHINWSEPLFNPHISSFSSKSGPIYKNGAEAETSRSHKQTEKSAKKFPTEFSLFLRTTSLKSERAHFLFRAGLHPPSNARPHPYIFRSYMCTFPLSVRTYICTWTLKKQEAAGLTSPFVASETNIKIIPSGSGGNQMHCFLCPYFHESSFLAERAL